MAGAGPNHRLRTLMAALVMVAALTVGRAPQARPAWAANATVGTGTAASCSASALNTALNLVQASGSGQIDFACGAAPHSIVISGTLNITSSVIFEGGAAGKITLSGGNTWRVFSIGLGGSLTLNRMVVTAGVVADGLGGCILNVSGLLYLAHTIVHTCQSGPPLASERGVGPNPGGPQASDGGPSSGGGAIYNGANVVTLLDSQVLSSTANTGGGIQSNGNLVLIDSRVAGNRALDYGGGLDAFGAVTIVNSLFEHNSANIGGAFAAYYSTQLSLDHTRVYSNIAGAIGGGIFSEGVLTVSQSLLEQNQAGTDGGGVYVYTGTASLGYAVLDGNRALQDGGGLFLRQGTLAVTGNKFTGNVGNRNGGGLLMTAGTATLTASHLTGNQAGSDGGAVWVDAPFSTITLTQVLVEGNQAANGAGMTHHYGGANLNRVTFSHNVATGLGGGYYDHDTGYTDMTNVTLSGNTAGNSGGGLHTAQTLTLTNVTIANNTAAGTGGLHHNGLLFPHTLRNVLLVDNTGAGGTDANCAGPAGTYVFSLSTDNTCAFGAGSNVNAPLGPLQINGGLGGLLLPTHLPLTGSAAIDGGTNTGCPPADERGAARPHGLKCDVGAVESGVLVPWIWLTLVRR